MNTPLPSRLGKSLLAGAALALCTAGSATAATAASGAVLTQVAAFAHQVTGVSVTPDGRRFVNFPRWTDDAPISVAEILPDGTLRAYPDAAWNAWRNATANKMSVADHFVCVQSVVADGRWQPVGAGPRARPATKRSCLARRNSSKSTSQRIAWPA